MLDARVTEMNRYFIREMLMYAQRDDVAGVTGALTDRKGRLTHGGFVLGGGRPARCAGEGTTVLAGGRYDQMKKVHNVSAVSLGCLLVKRANWLDLNEQYAGGLAAADLGLRQRQAGKWFVYTPHATAQLEKCAMLLSGDMGNAQDEARFETAWGKDLRDPCSGRMY